jgi:hypothetical protein
MASLLALVGLGIGLRILLVRAQTPGFTAVTDSFWYLIAAHVNVFTWAAAPNSYPWPAGYPAFLALVYVLDDHLSAVPLVQHALGLGTGVLWFLIVRRAVPSPWALLPAAVVLLAGPQLFIEHAPMAETLFAFLIAAATYGAVRAADRASVRWAIAAGLLVAAAGCVRVIGLPLIPLLSIWMLVGVRGSSRQRWMGAVVVALAAGLLIGSYLVEMKRETGYGGPTLTRSGNWKGPAPGLGRTEHDGYPKRVAQDLLRFWASDNRGPQGGFSYSGLMDHIDEPLDIDTKRPFLYLTQGVRYGAVAMWYSTTALNVNGGLVAFMHRYESLTRVEGPLFLLLLLLILGGIPFARGAQLTVGALVTGVAAVTLLTPVLFLYYDARYVVPGYGPLSAAAAIGGAMLWSRLVVPRRHARHRRATLAPSSVSTPGLEATDPVGP